MPTSSKKSKRIAFEVIQIAARGKMLGVVYAENETEAFELPISDFRIRRPELVRLIIRPV
jgi:hypothetical protein